LPGGKVSRGLERGGVYVPRFSLDDRPIASPDEDAFTLAAAAIETAEDGSSGGAPSRVHLVGEFPSVGDWGMAALLGGPTEVAKHSGSVDGLRTAVDTALAEPGDGRTWVVVAELGRATDVGALALRFGPRPTAAQPDWSGLLLGGTALSSGRVALEAIAPRAVVASPVKALPPLWELERADAFSRLSPGQVSEGAYVPRARYLENLPSRWRLEADRCAACHHLTFPRRGTCRSCGRSDQLSLEALPRDGARVVATTVIRQGGQPTEFDPQVEAIGPYGVVLAEFVPGIRLTLQVTDASPGQIPIGARIGTRLRRLYPMEGEWRYGRKAVPLSPERPQA
jgi:uncharacterized OB-fold protein